MEVLSREEMYKVDKYTMNEIGISSPVLMENAGKGCVDYMINNFLSENDKILIIAGTGNNGGDGFVIGRWLSSLGYFVKIIVVGKKEKMSRETAANLGICTKLDMPIITVESSDEWYQFKSQNKYQKFDLIVDALFGIGLKGEVKGWRKEVIDYINGFESQKVSVDIPSGVDAQTGAAKFAVHATTTLTMDSPKYGHVLGKGREKTGSLRVINIGVPKYVHELIKPNAEIINDERDIKFPERSPLSHKGQYGRVGIIAGSPGYSGAAVMAARSALNSGAGLINLFHPVGMDTIFENSLLEVMTMPLSYDFEANQRIKGKLLEQDVALIGPGIGTDEKSVQLLKTVLMMWNKPLIIDADGLNILAANKNFLNLLKDKAVLLTPHVGEFARLCGQNIDTITDDPIKHLQKFYKEYGISLLLKSATTIYIDSEGIVFDITGNDGLSTGGSGDVLSGIISSFVAQKNTIRESAVAASYLLGKTAENLATIYKTPAITPSRIIENIFKK